MEETLLLQNYTYITKELEKGLLLKQNTELISDQILITITISIKRNNKVLYSLKSYVQKINEYQQQIDNYKKVKEKESLELLKTISSSVKAAMEAVAEELFKYLEEAGEEAKKKVK